MAISKVQLKNFLLATRNPMSSIGERGVGTASSIRVCAMTSALQEITRRTAIRGAGVSHWQRKLFACAKCERFSTIF